MTGAPGYILCALLAVLGQTAAGQFLMAPRQTSERVTTPRPDLAILESADGRNDLPCTVTHRKAKLGFDLRFHSGYEVAVPLKELAGSGDALTVLFRIYPQEKKSRVWYFVQHFRVPAIDDRAKGDAFLEGEVDLGEGKYHVDWLMRDRTERTCSSNWNLEAALSAKDKPVPLFIDQNKVDETIRDPFAEGHAVSLPHGSMGALKVKLLVNFGPQDKSSLPLQRVDVDLLVNILRAIERNPRVGRVSLVAFNIEEARIVYRQDTAQKINFSALGKALQLMKPGTVTIEHLGNEHSGPEFLKNFIEKEVRGSTHADAVIFAGPKMMLGAEIRQNDLRRIGDVELPVFYVNYKVNPQQIRWNDSISHAVQAFKGNEYTISRPRDLWLSTNDIVSRVVRSSRKKQPQELPRLWSESLTSLSEVTTGIPSDLNPPGTPYRSNTVISERL